MSRFKETLPLTVKCSYEGRSKRVYLQTVADMCYGTLKRKVEETVVLSAAVPFIIRYLDDESKEYCTIADDQELHEAVKYFSSGFDDLPVSSNASTQSGRSRSSKKVGLEVEIVRDCDVSLSDSGSLASLEEYRERNLSNRSLTFPDRGEPEDDCVTVSSRNPQSEASLRPSAATRRGNSWLRLPRLASKSSKLTRNTERASSRNSSTYEESRPSTSQDNLLSVFERLKLEEDGPTPGIQPSAADDRRVAWVQEQQRQKLMPWAVNRSSEGDDEASSLDLGSQLDGDFELERASSGRYYYSYTSSQAYDDDGTQISGLPEALRARPSSMQLDWLADQQAGPSYRHPTHVQSAPSFYTASTDTLTQSRPPEDILTDCSKCHNLLDTFRYVCVICGPKTPLQHIPDGGKDSQIPTSFNYPPPQRRVLSDPPPLVYSNSSRIFSGSTKSLGNIQKPIQNLAIPNSNHSDDGYELCHTCLSTYGVDHAIEAAFSAGSSPNSHSSYSGSRDSPRTRSAPSKGKSRHAYVEMIWGVGRWDVVQDESVASNCSFCGCKLDSRHLRYKCANCEDIKMCAGCYGQIHDVHPNHATLVLNESYVIPSLEDFGDEGPPSHGVKCINCSLDIVGARFHCAICENIDICSQCESAGLPGNLDSTDGGHISSHIMIKFPHPPDPSQLGDLSRKARDRWTRDGISVGFHQKVPTASSVVSGYGTVVNGGYGHNTSCSACAKPIIGARYQCASCPSLPCGYSLCSDCEEKSYLVHDPHHIFFKLPRPVDRPLQLISPFIPPLYSIPAGPPPGVIQANPKDYLENLKHSASICDRCMDYIEGVWFRCAYCPKDLCDRCAEVDSHDVNHIFLLFKSTVDMVAFRSFAHLEDPDAPPIIPYAVYY